MAFSFYRLYGLRLQSDTVLPFLQPDHYDKQPIDCRLWFEGKRPMPLPVLPFTANDLWEFDPNFVQRSEIIRRDAENIFLTRSVILTRSIDQQFTCLSYVDGSAFLFNHDMSEMWINTPENYSLEYVVGYLLGTVAAYMLVRRRMLCLHASGIMFDGGVSLFVGDSGAGKSTIAAHFALRGYRVVTDDIAPVFMDGTKGYVLPSYPMLRLRPSATTALMGSETALPFLAPDWHKQYMMLQDGRAGFVNTPVQLRAIYILASRAATPSLMTLSSSAALVALLQSTYLGSIMGTELRKQDFGMLTQLVESVPVHSLNPPNIMGQLDVLRTLLEPNMI